MNTRQRFHETIRGGSPDRVPYFEEGLRDEVLEAWRAQGMHENDLSSLPSDRREEIQPDLDPSPPPQRWPTTVEEVRALNTLLDPYDPDRLPKEWFHQVRALRDHDHVVMLRVHRGFFLSLGVYGWDRMLEVMYLLKDDPSVVRQSMAQQAQLATALFQRVLSDVEVDAVVFTEPIGGNDGPLLSPRMYEDFVLSSYDPILELCRDHSIDTIILRTYANARALIPSCLERGINCLWACEVNTEAMDYFDLRREFGTDLRLIGGIDLDVLRQDRAAIRRELETKVPPLLAEGRYIPLADGR
ncbi:MAG: hypothetical protein GY906_37820, partial [bacterium]|nr:hypothetical protein [bacterium]